MHHWSILEVRTDLVLKKAIVIGHVTDKLAGLFLRCFFHPSPASLKCKNKNNKKNIYSHHFLHEDNRYFSIRILPVLHLSILTSLPRYSLILSSLSLSFLPFILPVWHEATKHHRKSPYHPIHKLKKKISPVNSFPKKLVVTNSSAFPLAFEGTERAFKGNFKAYKTIHIFQLVSSL